MRIVYAKNKTLEKHGLLVKIIRILSVPLLNSLPAELIQKLMKKTSSDAKTVVQHGGSTHALEVMYTRYQRGLFSRGIFQGFADLFWHHCVSQPKALRNRLKIVEKIIQEEISRKAQINTDKKILLLSVGSGSSRAMMHTLNNIPDKKLRNRTRVINIDKSQKAIDLGKQIVEYFNLQNNFKWLNDDARNIKEYIGRATIDIAEMVGLLDYFSDEKGTEVIKQIYEALKDNGLIVIANVYPNREQPFVHKTGWPKMYYRRPEELNNLLEKAGFREITIIFEPLKCHIIATARK